MTRMGSAVLSICALCAACKSKSQEPKHTAGSAIASGAQGVGSGPTAPPKAEGDAPATPPTPPDMTAKLGTAKPLLAKMAADATVVRAVQAQNGKKLALEAIKELDKEWSAASGVTPKMKPYLESPCAKALDKYAVEMPALVEAFAMDNQGALVCSTKKTSDFWQGDEDKWQKSFAEGKGAEFVDKPKFDESSQTYSVQVSVPVMDGKQAIGAITIGLAMDKL